MIKAEEKHKQYIIDLLAACFDKNKSVNWIIKQDYKRKDRIRALIDYSFEVCLNSDHIFLSDDLNAVILCHLSDDKLPFLQEAWLCIKFVFTVSGIDGIGRALKREKYIRSFHSEEEYIYIWFIGVSPRVQGTGAGGALIKKIIAVSNEEQKPIYLETSEERNVAFYKHFGFEVYHIAEEDIFGYKLFFLRRLHLAMVE